VPRYGERAEGAEIPSVSESEEAEGDKDEEDGFLVDVPAEEKGGVGAEDDGADEGWVVGCEPEFDKGKLWSS
jgi:hypothetical protein